GEQPRILARGRVARRRCRSQRREPAAARGAGARRAADRRRRAYHRASREGPAGRHLLAALPGSPQDRTFRGGRRAQYGSQSPRRRRAALQPRLRLLLAALAVVTLLSAPLGGTADAQVFKPTRYLLDNGLEVIVVTNRRAPVVTHMLWYKVGSADEPLGKSGIAHFLEHLMFKGTDSRAPGEFSAIVARNGGRENAFTSYDYTGYYQTVAKDRLALMMELEADRMANLTITDEIVLPEREVIIEERRSRVDNDP